MLDPRDAPPDYDLVVTDGRRRLVLYHRDVGVWLGGESVGFLRKGERLTRPFRDIASVSLATHGLPRVGVVAHCDIRFLSGERAVVANIDGHGFPDAQRSDRFRDFVSAFHSRLVQAGLADRIAFRSGYSDARSTMIMIALIAGALLFVALPIGLFVATGDLGTLVLLLGGAVLLLPAFRVLGPNRPATYTPDKPPDLLARSAG